MPTSIHAETTKVFFKEMVDRALAQRRLESSEASAFYLVELLSSFLRPERLFSEVGIAPDCPLAEIVCRARGSEGGRRLMLLKLAGDLSLFTTGFFPDSLARGLVSTRYYVELGGQAYGELGSAERLSAAAEIYDELSAKFQGFVDVLNEVSAECTLTDDGNLLRLYESWLDGRSERGARLLRERGILVVPSSRAIH